MDGGELGQAGEVDQASQAGQITEIEQISEIVAAEPSHTAWLQQARSHLRGADPVLARLIAERPDFDPQAWMATLLPPLDLYGALMWQVTSSITCPASRKYSTSPRNGGPTAPWRPFTCTPPPA